MGWGQALFWPCLIALVALLGFKDPDDLDQDGDLSPPLELDPAFEDLPHRMKTWWNRGRSVLINGHSMFYVSIDDPAGCASKGDPNSDPVPAAEDWSPPDGAKEAQLQEEYIIIMHGYPTSSFDYRLAMEEWPAVQGRSGLRCTKVLLFDHVGFGFSQKPAKNFSYSIMDHADNALQLWKALGIQQAHIVAHDMGDSVLTEILARRHRDLLPRHFHHGFFKSVTFTNGGMRYDLINFRLAQSLLHNPFAGGLIDRLASNPWMAHLIDWMAARQLEGIWGPQAKGPAPAEMTSHIKDIGLLTSFRGGGRIRSKTIRYLKDREAFEERWYSALRALDIPCMMLWGDSDAVSPMAIPKYLARHVFPSGMFTGKVIKDGGHFIMLEKPKEWMSTVAAFVAKHQRSS